MLLAFLLECQVFGNFAASVLTNAVLVLYV
jgi:hypothetical protein